MKKTLLLAAFLLLALPAVQGQALIALVFGKNLETDNFKLGLFLAEQGSFIQGSGSDKPKLGLAVGAYTDIKFGRHDRWILQNYMVFKAPKGGRDLDVERNALITDPGILRVAQDIDRSLTYFEITPLMRYCLTPSWSIGVGPFVGFRLIARDAYNASNDEGKFSYTVDIKKKINTVDSGFAADIQYRFSKGRGLQLNARYQQSLTNLYRDDAGDKNMLFQIGIGIPIVGKKRSDVETK